MKGMIKFDIKESQYAFYLLNQTSECLFEFGYGYNGNGDMFIKNIIKYNYIVVNVHMNMKE